MSAGTSTATKVDGRRIRREQGRLAVVDALIDAVLDGGTLPSTEEIAARAGVSTASVFRYFESLDDLRHAGIRRYLERYDHLLDVPGLGEHGLERRIATLVDARQRFYETIEPMGRLTRAQAVTVPELDAALGRLRATLTEQVAQHFAAELAALRPARRRELVALVAALTSYESWEQLRRHGLDRAAVGRAMRLGVERLLDVRKNNVTDRRFGAS